MIHNSIMEESISQDEHHVMVWSAAFVQGLLDDKWKFYRG